MQRQPFIEERTNGHSVGIQRPMFANFTTQRTSLLTATHHENIVNIHTTLEHT